MTKLSKSFAFVVPQLGPPINVLSPTTSGELIDVFSKPATVLENQIKHFADIGLHAVARQLNSMLPEKPNTQLPPPQALLNALSDPITYDTIIQLWFNRLFGQSSGSRLNMVRHYLTLGLSESGLKSASSVHTSVLYKGVMTPTYTRGQLQFTTGTYKSAVTMGSGILKKSRVLNLVHGLIVKATAAKGKIWKAYSTDPSSDPNQAVANLGWMYLLINQINKEWLWTAEGWQIATSPTRQCNASVLLKEYHAILADYDMGTQLLMTFYHINGLYALYSTSLSHKDRLAEDVVTFHELGLIPGLTVLLQKSIPVPLTALTPEQGDIDDPDLIKDTEVSGISLNAFIKRLYNFVFHHEARGDGHINSSYGVKRTLKDADTGKVSTHVHGGIDMAAVKGQPVFALEDGVVTRSVNGGKLSYGNIIEIKPDLFQGRLLYGHLSERLVEAGTNVRKGDIVGFAGSTGFSTGPHLHVQWNPEINGKVSPNHAALPKGISSVTNAINAKGT